MRKRLYVDTLDKVVSKKVFWKTIDSLGESFWADMPLLPWAKDLWHLCQQRFGKNNTFILSSPSKHSSCAAGKVRWIQKHFNTHNFMLGSAKYLCARPDKSLLIDDSAKKVGPFKEHGGEVFHWPNSLLLKDNPQLLEQTFRDLESLIDGMLNG